MFDAKCLQEFIPNQGEADFHTEVSRADVLLCGHLGFREPLTSNVSAHIKSLLASPPLQEEDLVMEVGGCKYHLHQRLFIDQLEPEEKIMSPQPGDEKVHLEQ